MYKQFIGFGGEVSQTAIQRLSDGSFIPFDESNKDYVEYLEWLNAGNTPEPPTPIAQGV